MNEIKFYLDENVANAVANGLRHRNIDVLTTPEANNIGADDKTQLQFALDEERVIVTQDDDMLRLASENIEHAGIAYYKPQTRTVKQILQALNLIYEVLTPEEMYNHIEFL